MRGSFFVIGLCLLVAGCQTSVFNRQITQCRRLLPALNPDKTQFSNLAILAGASRRDVEMSYVATDSTGLRHAKTLECRFDLSPEHHLAVVVDDGVRLGSSSLFVLRKVWLDTPDAALQDPHAHPGRTVLPGKTGGWQYFLQIALNGLVPAMIYGLLAATFSLIYGLIGRINLAIGAIAVLGAAVTFIVIAPLAQGGALGLTLGIGLALGAAVVVGALHGYVISHMVFLPMARARGQQILVATLGLSLFFQEYLRLAQGTNAHWLPSLFDTALQLNAGHSFAITITPKALLVMAFSGALGIALMLLMRFGTFGRDWRACADDNLAAAMFGISPAATFTRTLMMASALAALTGALISLNYGTLGYDGAITLDLRALVAAVVGGIGSIPGAFVGGALIALMESFWTGYFAGGYRDLITDSVLVLVIMFRPSGLLGTKN